MPEPRYDHEHPCPSRGCAEAARRRGEAMPDEADCCVCWRRKIEGQAVELLNSDGPIKTSR